MAELFVAFKDDSEENIIAIFCNEQNSEFWPFQGVIDLEDPRYQTYYDARPTLFQLGLPTPQRSI